VPDLSDVRCSIAQVPIPRTPHFGPIVTVLLPAPPECQPYVNFTHWKDPCKFVNIRHLLLLSNPTPHPVNLIEDNIITILYRFKGLLFRSWALDDSPILLPCNR